MDFNEIDKLSPVELAYFLRSSAYVAAAENLRSKLDQGYFDTDRGIYSGTPFHFTMLDPRALAAWTSSWRGHPRRLHNWNWAEYQREFINSPSRFELAVWSGTVLCGLAVGKLSRGRENLSVQLLEGSPDPHHPLKGITRFFLIETAQFYAVTMQCKWLYLIDPLEGAQRLYEDMGFVLARTSGKMIAYAKELR